MVKRKVSALEDMYENIISDPSFIKQIEFISVQEIRNAIVYLSKIGKANDDTIDLLLERIKNLSKIYVLEFQDCGQDFLQWEVLEDGSIINSIPFQASQWTKYKVVNLEALILGQSEYVIISSLENSPFAIKHKVLGCILAK